MGFGGEGLEDVGFLGLETVSQEFQTLLSW